LRARKLTINLVSCDPVLCERIRASLRRSPFLFHATDEPLPGDEVDLYVVPAAEVQGLSAGRAPVIGWGPAGMLRTAFLSGCEDYLRDPWTPEELSLRAMATLARVERRFDFPWGTLFFEAKDLQTPAGPISLTLHESRILRALLRARGQPVPRAALACLTAGTPGIVGSRAVDVHVAALRRKVREAVPLAGRFIVCVRNQGYMLP
jgi:CheY-like chemotaxis protein